jgi:transketolase C-terminal domain/subunit
MGWGEQLAAGFVQRQALQIAEEMNREGLKATNVMHITGVRPDCI